MEPITPEQVAEKKLKHIPPMVLGIFNQMIAEDFDQGRAVLYQDEIVDRILAKMEVDRNVIFVKGWLNIEKIYEKAGWKVQYDKPSIGDNYKAHFIFTPKSK